MAGVGRTAINDDVRGSYLTARVELHYGFDSFAQIAVVRKLAASLVFPLVEIVPVLPKFASGTEDVSNQMSMCFFLRKASSKAS